MDPTASLDIEAAIKVFWINSNCLLSCVQPRASWFNVAKASQDRIQKIQENLKNTSQPCKPQEEGGWAHVYARCLWVVGRFCPGGPPYASQSAGHFVAGAPVVPLRTAGDLDGPKQEVLEKDGDATIYHIPETPAETWWDAAQSRHEFTPGTVLDEISPPGARALEPAFASAGDVQQQVRSFLDGIKCATPLLESQLEIPEIEEHLSQGDFTEEERHKAVKLLEMYRLGKSIDQSIADREGTGQDSGATKPDAALHDPAGKDSPKATSVENPGGRSKPVQSKEYWQFLVYMDEYCTDNLLHDQEPLNFPSPFNSCLHQCLSLRLYRYVQPRKNGTYVCSEDVLKLYKTSEGRILVEYPREFSLCSGFCSKNVLKIS